MFILATLYRGGSRDINAFLFHMPYMYLGKCCSALACFDRLRLVDLPKTRIRGFAFARENLRFGFGAPFGRRPIHAITNSTSHTNQHDR